MRTVHGIYSYQTGKLYYFFDVNDRLADVHEHVSKTRITQNFTYIIKVRKNGEIEIIPKPKWWIKYNLIAKVPVTTPDKIPLNSNDVIKILYNLDLDPGKYAVEVDKYHHHTIIEVYETEKPFVLNMYPFMQYKNYEIFAIDKNEYEIHNFDFLGEYVSSIRVDDDVFLFNFANRETKAKTYLYDHMQRRTYALVVDASTVGEIIFSSLKINVYDLKIKYHFTDPYLIFATLYKPL